MLFDWLVIGQVVPMNPASSVRGPKYVVKPGKTPVLKADEARVLLASEWAVIAEPQTSKLVDAPSHPTAHLLSADPPLTIHVVLGPNSEPA